ncbi:AFG1-like ATPase [Teratosphaeria destructans]|uniref:AFG1-like ATPase n=1 Tax=Teratosphaeria destructans TaxID=418781 RepID=A0A9W7W171_9PEZI|nr:AFG1-like ATPase [Teratosphaeria destructans]
MSSTAFQTAYKGLIQRGRLLTDPHQAALITRLDQLQAELASRNHAPPFLPGRPAAPPTGLYIYGSVGTGKSRLMDLFAATLPPTVTRRRIHFHEFMMDVHSRLHVARASPSYAGDPLIQIGRAIREESQVLAFDEFQVTDIADAMILARLFGSIWQHGGVMVGTSNRHPDDLYENGLNRDVVRPFIRQLQQRCEVWEMGGRQDYRTRTGQSVGGEREENFLVDGAAFRRRLELVRHGRRLEQVSIPVQGSRVLTIDAVVSERHADRLSVVSSRFEDLCQRNLGSADYHALCSRAETIFLAGLRSFRLTERDFVRRFITLIDLAYETKTRIVCLSSVPIGEVFVEIANAEQNKAPRSGMGMKVKGQGGASSSMMSTFIGGTEWSATGLMEASLATGGAGETDVGFAIGRALSRLYEMGSPSYGTVD